MTPWRSWHANAFHVTLMVVVVGAGVTTTGATAGAAKYKPGWNTVH